MAGISILREMPSILLNQKFQSCKVAKFQNVCTGGLHHIRQRFAGAGQEKTPSSQH
jgi:hypothetical protein